MLASIHRQKITPQQSHGVIIVDGHRLPSLYRKNTLSSHHCCANILGGIRPQDEGGRSPRKNYVRAEGEVIFFDLQCSSMIFVPLLVLDPAG